MIDYVLRYDPDEATHPRHPANPEEARKALVEGNRVYSSWMSRCLQGDGDHQYVVPCGGIVAPPESKDVYLKQQPFAVVLGCSDARVPTEMLFGQGFNELFVVRVAGNVLGDAVLGTIDFSLAALVNSVRVLVVLGHTNCSAVKGAVEAYLDPKKLWSKSNSPFLRLIFQRIFVAVRESDNAIRQVWGRDAHLRPGYREALTDMAVCLNAAQNAFSLRQQVESAGNWELEVLYGVYDVHTHQVCMPLHPGIEPSLDHVNLAYSPSHPREFADIAAEIAELHLKAADRSDHA